MNIRQCGSALAVTAAVVGATTQVSLCPSTVILQDLSGLCRKQTGELNGDEMTATSLRSEIERWVRDGWLILELSPRIQTKPGEDPRRCFEHSTRMSQTNEVRRPDIAKAYCRKELKWLWEEVMLERTYYVKLESPIMLWFSPTCWSSGQEGSRGRFWREWVACCLIGERPLHLR